jgi:hypothetical protein
MDGVVARVKVKVKVKIDITNGFGIWCAFAFLNMEIYTFFTVL